MEAFHAAGLLFGPRAEVDRGEALFAPETDGRVFLVSSLRFELSPRPSTPCYGWEEGSGQISPRDEHSSAVGIQLVRPRRSGRVAPRAR